MTATRILGRVFADLKENEGSMRNEAKRRLWFIKRLRERCSAVASPETHPLEGSVAPESVPTTLEAGSPEPSSSLCIPALIHRLAEPDRTALALFYTGLLDLEHAASLLEINVAEFAAIISRGRDILALAVAAPMAALPSPNHER